MAADLKLRIDRYSAQRDRWPATGRVVFAQFDDDAVVVYQAYRPAIGHFAARNGFFGGAFKLDRMTWIKPGFLWMMHRSQWGQSDGQQVVLAVRLRRSAFDAILAASVHSAFRPGVYGTHDAWRQRLATSDVRLQWDPDHSPTGEKLDRRAVQLGLRGEAVARYSREWILDIEDVSDFVAEQREHIASPSHEALWVPREDVYPVNREVAAHLELSDTTDGGTSGER